MSKFTERLSKVELKRFEEREKFIEEMYYKGPNKSAQCVLCGSWLPLIDGLIDDKGHNHAK